MDAPLLDGLTLLRRTADFDATTVPPGLLREHRIAAGVWGFVRVRQGSLRFVWEVTDADPASVELSAGDAIVVPPEVPHRVELGPGARFAVEFHR